MVDLTRDPSIKASALTPPLGGATGVFRHLRLLGTDPANWTAHPLG
jgi:hypothetical protein